jgi:hypothetical protein
VITARLSIVITVTAPPVRGLCTFAAACIREDSCHAGPTRLACDSLVIPWTSRAPSLARSQSETGQQSWTVRVTVTVTAAAAAAAAAACGHFQSRCPLGHCQCQWHVPVTLMQSSKSSTLKRLNWLKPWPIRRLGPPGPGSGRGNFKVHEVVALVWNVCSRHLCCSGFFGFPRKFRAEIFTL